MRNLVEFPITTEEIIKTIDKIPDGSGIGGLDGVIRMGLKAYYLRYPEKLHEVAESMIIHGKMNTGCFGQ